MRRFTTTTDDMTSSNCSFSGLLNAGYHLEFGTSYVFHLTSCKIGACYAIIDDSYTEGWAYVRGLRPSTFSEFTATGVSSFNLSSAGAYFRPTETNITLEFTTQTCDDFYKLHPYTHPQNCTGGVFVTGPLNGPPLCGEDVNYLVEKWA